MTKLDPEEIDYLKSLIEARGIHPVIEALSDIARDHAESLAVDRQQASLAKTWATASFALATAAAVTEYA